MGIISLLCYRMAAIFPQPVPPSPTVWCSRSVWWSLLETAAGRLFGSMTKALEIWFHLPGSIMLTSALPQLPSSLWSSIKGWYSLIVKGECSRLDTRHHCGIATANAKRQGHRSLCIKQQRSWGPCHLPQYSDLPRVLGLRLPLEQSLWMRCIRGQPQ